jgi:hypothetical protein
MLLLTRLCALGVLALLQWMPTVVAFQAQKTHSQVPHVLDGVTAWVSESVNWTISFPNLASVFIGGRLVMSMPAPPVSLIFTYTRTRPFCNISAHIRRGHVDTAEWSTNGLFRASCHLQYLSVDVTSSGALGGAPTHANFGAAYPGFEEPLLTAESHPPSLFWGVGYGWRVEQPCW